MTPQRIKHVRTSLGLSQSELARRLDVTATTISLWETGRTAPALALRRQLTDLESSIEEDSPPPAFRPIQYLGSKLKLAGRIGELVQNVSAPGDTIGDLFSGSGVVSGMLTRYRRTVAVDMQRYASVLAEALLTGDTRAAEALREPAFLESVDTVEKQSLDIYREMVALDDQAIEAAAAGYAAPLDDLIAFGSLAAYRQAPRAQTPKVISNALLAVSSRLGQEAVPVGVASYYGGVYFSMRQAIALDAINSVLDSANDEARRLGRAVVLSVTSELANTVGKQFAQPLRIVKAEGAAQPLLLARAARDRRSSVVDTWKVWLQRWDSFLATPRLGGQAVQGDVLDFVERDQNCTAFYADPPYTIDHYSRFYHVLETVSRRDTPRLDTQRQRGVEQIMRGLYRTDRYQSPFSVPSMVATAFQQLFERTARGGRPLVLSYSPFDSSKGHRPRLLNLEEMVGMARRSFRRVEAVETASHSHRKLNARAVNGESPTTGEVLIVCEI